MSKASEIVEALMQWEENLVRSGELVKMNGDQFMRGRIRVVEATLGAQPLPQSTVPNIHKVSVNMVTVAYMHMMECILLGKDASEVSLNQLRETTRAWFEAELHRFAAEVRTGVMQEVAQGAGAADELLRKATT